MHIPPSYTLNSKITRLLSEIDRLTSQLNSLDINELTLKFHRRKSILKSSLYSARIEGNPLNTSSIDNLNALPQSKAKIELTNLVRAIEKIESKSWQNDLTESDLLGIHTILMTHLEASAGHFRTEPSAIFNLSGVAVYVCPPPSELKELIQQLIKYINQDSVDPAPIKVALSHFVYEKIHPFIDGNGRLGRVLIHLLMKKYGYNLRGLSAYEEYIDNHRSDYYDLLGTSSGDITNFVEFILESFVSGLSQGVTILTQTPPPSKENQLLPRRQEILALIRDHQLVSFDFIHRRFMAVPPRTLRYDLKYLSDHEFILKLGSTKGSLYSIVSHGDLK